MAQVSAYFVTFNEVPMAFPASYSYPDIIGCAKITADLESCEVHVYHRLAGGTRHIAVVHPGGGVAEGRDL